MTVNEKQARLWGKLTGREIDTSSRGPIWLHRADEGGIGTLIPDPAVQPWEWVKTLLSREAGTWTVRIQLADPVPPDGHLPPARLSAHIDDYTGVLLYMGYADTPELALAAAIDKMAEDAE